MLHDAAGSAVNMVEAIKKLKPMSEVTKNSRMDELAALEEDQPPKLSEILRGRIRRLLRRTEVLFGVISIAYLLLVVADMLLDSFNDYEYKGIPRYGGATNGTTCELQKLRSLYDDWFDIFVWVDLALLIFFSCEITMQVIVCGTTYLTSSTINTVDTISVGGSLILALMPDGDFPLVRMFRAFRIVKVLAAYNRIQQARMRFKGNKQIALSMIRQQP